MLPGQDHMYTTDEFKEGLVCGVVGCSRRARHQWAYPCAINTTLPEPNTEAWMPVCDECDIELNEVLLSAMGVPHHVLYNLMESYKLIQGDVAFDAPDKKET